LLHFCRLHVARFQRGRERNVYGSEENGGAENIGLKRMDALLFIARKLSLSHFKNIIQYNNVLRTFLTKFVAIVTASFKV